LPSATAPRLVPVLGQPSGHMVEFARPGRPQLTQADRALLAAFSRALPRQVWRRSLFVTPTTLLRWHREVVAAAGRIRIGVPDARQRLRRCVSSWCGSRGRTRAGDTDASRASWSGSGSNWRRARSGRSCGRRGSSRRRGASSRAGVRSCGLRLRASSSVTGPDSFEQFTGVGCRSVYRVMPVPLPVIGTPLVVMVLSVSSIVPIALRRDVQARLA
jgi:hypothetical protein